MSSIYVVWHYIMNYSGVWHSTLRIYVWGCLTRYLYSACKGFAELLARVVRAQGRYARHRVVVLWSSARKQVTSRASGAFKSKCEYDWFLSIKNLELPNYATHTKVYWLPCRAFSVRILHLNRKIGTWIQLVLSNGIMTSISQLNNLMVP